MKAFLSRISIFVLFACLLASCVSPRRSSLATQAADENRKIAYALPSLVVYKTVRDYSNNVPVVMNPERTRIVGYPGVTDIANRGDAVHPVALVDGYFLDNMGISANTVYLDYTFDEYVALESTPSVAQLMDHVVDLHPFVEIWNCGRRYGSMTVGGLNKIVSQGFPDCRRVL